MSENESNKHGFFSWNELMTNNIGGAKSFYSKMFGWEIEDLPTGQMQMSYSLVKKDGTNIGGIMQLPPEAGETPPFWGTYITVDDADKSAEKATSLGAKILVPPTDVPNVGRFCMMADPQGAAIAIISYFEVTKPN